MCPDLWWNPQIILTISNILTAIREIQRLQKQPLNFSNLCTHDPKLDIAAPGDIFCSGLLFHVVYSPIPRDYLSASQKSRRIGVNPTGSKQQQANQKGVLAMPLTNGRFMYKCTEACLRSSQTDRLVDKQACNILNFSARWLVNQY